jgi:hypothetical protein
MRTADPSYRPPEQGEDKRSYHQNSDRPGSVEVRVAILRSGQHPRQRPGPSVAAGPHERVHGRSRLDGD